MDSTRAAIASADCDPTPWRRYSLSLSLSLSLFYTLTHTHRPTRCYFKKADPRSASVLTLAGVRRWVACWSVFVFFVVVVVVVVVAVVDFVVCSALFAPLSKMSTGAPPRAHTHTHTHTRTRTITQ